MIIARATIRCWFLRCTDEVMNRAGAPAETDASLIAGLNASEPGSRHEKS